MRTIFLCLGILCLIGLSNPNTATAQRNCGSMEYLEYQQNIDPKRSTKMEQIELHTRNFAQNQANRAVNGVVTIPVVVHVIYNNSSQNISDAQVLTQITVLNEDFRRTNGDANNTWSQAADSEIEFCMATADPNGNATNGITRTSTTKTSFGTNDQMKFNSSGGKDAWPAGDYLNLWVCNISGSILGYAQFPGGSASTDGVVIDYQYYGTIGTASSPFDLGRTGTHEVGHWLNLRHIWGDGACGADDFVSDTPASDAANYNCATGHVSCSSTDMVENYMDYSDDACMNLYTTGQKTRMRALFDTGGFRQSLLNSTACGGGTPATCSDGIQNQGETGVDCGGPNCSACVCSGTMTTVSINFDNYPEETAWTITNSGGSVVASGGTYPNQADGSTLNIDICLADGCYDFTITDSANDGLCCGYGTGSYTVSGGGNTLASGAEFTSSQTTNFCVGGGPTPTCNDGVQNGNETGVDCGGSDCAACPTCNDGVQNGSETGVDCGGPDCAACPTCNDGVQNGSETGVDCGGPGCAACPTCNDGVQNGNETGIDCGGSDCVACPTCNDGIQNGSETGVDCGGPDCAPCSSGCNGTMVTISITLDNYPEETAWTLTNSGGSVVASGGTYANQADGSTVTIDECLADGCYDFNITDSANDGLCCGYGIGFYTVSGGGNTLASGGEFGSSETTNFCVGGGTAPTCSDGIQNGNETGVDCGGSDCSPCASGCTTVTVNNENFEGGWGIWNDGGSDSYRINSATYTSSGTYSIRLRDNTNSSVMTTDNLGLASFSEVTVGFNYYPQSMENNEDFWLQVSTNGGASYTTIKSWSRGTDFNNNQHYSESVTMVGTFSNTTRIRFRCDASSNADKVYFDDINISGCQNNVRTDGGESTAQGNFADLNEEYLPELSKVVLFPNPARDLVQVGFHLGVEKATVLAIVTDMTGKVILKQNWSSELGKQQQSLDMSQYDAGIYMLHMVSGQSRISQKFILIK